MFFFARVLLRRASLLLGGVIFRWVVSRFAPHSTTFPHLRGRKRVSSISFKIGFSCFVTNRYLVRAGWDPVAGSWQQSWFVTHASVAIYFLSPLFTVVQFSTMQIVIRNGGHKYICPCLVVSQQFQYASNFLLARKSFQASRVSYAHSLHESLRCDIEVKHLNNFDAFSSLKISTMWVASRLYAGCHSMLQLPIRLHRT